MLYGSRAKTLIFDYAVKTTEEMEADRVANKGNEVIDHDNLDESIIEGQSNCSSDTEELERQVKVNLDTENFMDKLVIDLDNPIK
jgi:hypothetical protein